MPRTNKILIRSGTVAPTASDFAVGEPAFDKSAGKLYIKNAAGAMVELGTGATGPAGDPATATTDASALTTGTIATERLPLSNQVATYLYLWSNFR